MDSSDESVSESEVPSSLAESVNSDPGWESSLSESESSEDVLG